LPKQSLERTKKTAGEKLSLLCAMLLVGCVFCQQEGTRKKADENIKFDDTRHDGEEPLLFPFSF
jgi:hypothetical protein